MPKSYIRDFSKLLKEEKLKILEEQTNITGLSDELSGYWHAEKQELFDNIAENTLSNYYLPYSIAPNFLINNIVYHVPMVVEESSVVAAASAAAKFWSNHGGFNAKVLSTIKTGHVHFTWSGPCELLIQHFSDLRAKLLEQTSDLTREMKKRGGGIKDIILEDLSEKIPDYFRIYVKFETQNAMGANFINSVLERMSFSLKEYAASHLSHAGDIGIIMSILSNYTPECLVECKVQTLVKEFESISHGMSAKQFAENFTIAVKIAETDTFRAVTHNKGIMNGIDAVAIATGNDFRAIEAGVHSYACRNGYYGSLSHADVKDEMFQLSITIPLAIGTIGGLTSLHPLAKRSLEILGNPNAGQLMTIITSAGLANHFSALKALITSGIQKGHMKMHLHNILEQLGASAEQKAKAKEWFEHQSISMASVKEFLKRFQAFVV